MIKAKRLIAVFVTAAVVATSVSHCEGAERPKQSQKMDCFAPSGLAMTKLAPGSRFDAVSDQMRRLGAKLREGHDTEVRREKFSTEDGMRYRLVELHRLLIRMGKFSNWFAAVLEGYAGAAMDPKFSSRVVGAGDLHAIIAMGRVVPVTQIPHPIIALLFEAQTRRSIEWVHPMTKRRKASEVLLTVRDKWLVNPTPETFDRYQHAYREIIRCIEDEMRLAWLRRNVTAATQLAWELIQLDPIGSVADEIEVENLLRFTDSRLDWKVRQRAFQAFLIEYAKRLGVTSIPAFRPRSFIIDVCFRVFRGSAEGEAYQLLLLERLRQLGILPAEGPADLHKAIHAGRSLWGVPNMERFKRLTEEMTYSALFRESLLAPGSRFGGKKISQKQADRLTAEDIEEAVWQAYLAKGGIPEMKDIAAQLGVSQGKLKRRIKELNKLRESLGLRVIHIPVRRRGFSSARSRALENEMNTHAFRVAWDMFEARQKKHGVWQQHARFQDAFLRLRIIRYLERVAGSPGGIVRGWFDRYLEKNIEEEYEKAIAILDVVKKEDFDFILSNFPAQAEGLLTCLQFKDFMSPERIGVSHAIDPRLYGDHRRIIVRAFPELKMDARDFRLLWNPSKDEEKNEIEGILNVRHRVRKHMPVFYARWEESKDGKLDEDKEQALREEIRGIPWEGALVRLGLIGGVNKRFVPYFEGSIGVMVAKSFTCENFDLKPMDVRFEGPEDRDGLRRYAAEFLRHGFARRFRKEYEIWRRSEKEKVSTEEANRVRKAIRSLHWDRLHGWGIPMRKVLSLSFKGRIADFLAYAFNTDNLPLERRDFELSWGSGDEAVVEKMRFKVSRLDPGLFADWQRISKGGATIEEQNKLRKRLAKITAVDLAECNALFAAKHFGSIPGAIAASFNTPGFELIQRDLCSNWTTPGEGIATVRHKLERYMPGPFGEYLELEKNPDDEELRKRLQLLFSDRMPTRLEGMGVKHAANKAVAPYFGGTVFGVVRGSLPALRLKDEAHWNALRAARRAP